ncbi:hypothetical protein EV196_106188 [Mariniflexile fucanivorans]|uniref:DUF4258 domain-containing protein n=1 Tax=Mariniflexile fucanivorans TaxID=264023 RepID=A0A4V2QDS6_9FLAO|nr:hypothetical protein [Mariniflexile fucanivorans]TCL64997.1 hypothetical protein EV196_106188 [Mariniflexile fucanivorans]
MKLIQRIGYYLGGFSLGLVILAFFLSGKKTSCSYGPDARVLKNIRLKKIQYTNGIQTQLLSNNLDSVAVDYILRKGNINFSESNAREKPCGIYLVEGDYNEKEITLTVQNCDSIATITNFRITD